MGPGAGPGMGPGAGTVMGPGAGTVSRLVDRRFPDPQRRRPSALGQALVGNAPRPVRSLAHPQQAAKAPPSQLLSKGSEPREVLSGQKVGH